MSIFALVSQSLRNGEPIHQIMPTSLLDRLLYHSSHQELSARDDSREKISFVERVTSFDFLFFATGKFLCRGIRFNAKEPKRPFSRESNYSSAR